MRNALSFPLLLTVLFLLSNCNLLNRQRIVKAEKSNTMANEISPNQLKDRYWKLVEINGESIANDTNKEPHLLLATEDNRISGTGGCNDFSGSFILKEPGRIQFMNIATTRMACLNMETDAALYNVLEVADNYSVIGDTLRINRAEMAPEAKFIAVEQENAALNGDWELNYISGPKIAFEGLFPNKKPTLTVSLPDTKVSGSSGCNRFTSTIKIDENNINFGQIASTKMFCEGDGEATYFNTLQKINRYSVSSDKTTLTLIVGDIAMMRFSRKQ